jgi:PPOX class probable F420-dependent enzyme
MELTDALAFVRQHRNGVLVTQKRDGRPQLSNIIYAAGEDGVVRISITADRAKYKNLVRTRLASLHVTRDDFYAYVVLDAEVELSAVAQAPDDATVDELVALYQAMVGQHDNWDEYRAAMVRDHRVVARLTPTHAYGMLPPPA